ncbi:MAG: four helix bundle protein [Mesorhizobium sp.]|nr:four helix bundle protein [Mesorhizobium sp.]MBL8578780.1 four helix bundle protein [Mesorhizobium sp.]
MQAAVNSYRDLLVWQASMDLAVICYASTKDFPKAEVYGMTSQIRRASTSVAANIAEGYGRENTGSYSQFLRIAQGSLKELETLVILSQRVGLMTDGATSRLLVQSDEVGKMLRSLIRRLQVKS